MSGKKLHSKVVPARYVLLMLELAEERGVDGDVLLQGLDLDRDRLDAPNARVSLLQHRYVCMRALQRTGDDALGIAFGLRATLTTHGMTGFGLMAQTTAEDLFRFAERFGAPLQLPAWTLSFYRDGDDAVMQAVETVRYAPLHRFACEQLCISAVSMIRELMQPEPPCELRFDFPEPPYFRQYRERLPPVRFSAGVTQLRIPEAHLRRRLRHGDALAARAAEQECARELDALDAADDVVQQVHQLLDATGSSYPDLRRVAQRLHTSPRTLSRRLHAHGTNFRELLEEARRRDSLVLLERRDRSIDEIAARLGYGSAANFTRAFQRWTGKNPGEYRAQLPGPST